MGTLALILLATLAVSLLSFVGVALLLLSKRVLSRLLLLLVAASAGALMGDAFLHLLPDALQDLPATGVFVYVLLGFSAFFLIEKLLCWHHFHEHEEVHSFAAMNLVGDAVHNFIDGLLIAASFVASTGLGAATTLAVALHEIPQEISDMGVLLHGGFSRRRALLMSFLTALAAILGGVVGFALSQGAARVPALLALTAGGFVYIGASDLIPELRKETGLRASLTSFGVFVLGVLMMAGLLLLEP